MSGAVTFDDLDQQGSGGPVRKAFFELDFNNESEVLAWLNEELQTLRSASWTKLEKIKHNYMRYKGIQYQEQAYMPRDVLESKKRYSPKMVVPFIRDAVDEKVSKLLEFKPSVFPMPTHDESKDKNDSKIAKRFLQHIDYTKGTDALFRKLIRNSKIAGESYLWVSWNPDLGEMMPVEDGEMVMNGDVQIKNKTPFFVFFPDKEWADVDYCFVVEWVDTPKLKVDYPNMKDKITPDSIERYFDFNTLTEKQAYNQTQKIHFYHKKTKYLPEGYETCFTKLGLLKKGALSYAHGELPLVQVMDQENPDENRGESFIEYTRSIAAVINNFINMAIKSFSMASHAKWFVEAGSVDEQELNNDVGIVRVKNGSSKPILAQANPVSTQFQPLVEYFKGLYYQMVKSNSIARGELPEGVTAFVALQFVSEAENRRSSTEVTQANEAIRKTYDLILKTCGQFYKPTDKRTIQIMGKDGKFMLQDYSVDAIAKPYNIILQSSSGLPESKALRTQFIVDMSNARPDLIPDEQVVEMIGFGQTEKFMDVATAAARAAEDENELIMDGTQMLEPSEVEEHITHWRIHTMAMQDINFKLKATPEILLEMKDHVLATEYLMAQQAKVSPQYVARLLTLPQFPMFLIDNEMSQLLMMASGMGQAIQQNMPQPTALPNTTQVQ